MEMRNAFNHVMVSRLLRGPSIQSLFPPAARTSRINQSSRGPGIKSLLDSPRGTQINSHPFYVQLHARDREAQPRYSYPMKTASLESLALPTAAKKGDDFHPSTAHVSKLH